MGRPKGSPNRATRDVKEAAREYTSEALRTLANIVRRGKTEQARVAAAKELLDRGYGKATTHIEANVNLLERMDAGERAILEAALEAIARDKGEAVEGTAHTTH